MSGGGVATLGSDLLDVGCHFGAGLAADGATVAYASDAITPSPPHPRNDTLIRLRCRSEAAQIVSANRQHDPPHRTAAGALDAGQQLRLPRAAAAAVVAHPVEDVAEQHVAVYQVCFGDQPLLAAAVAHDPQEPRRESP
jgi:hypothetical protein